MLPFQWEDGGVVKRGHAVQPVVTILAGWAKEGDVLGHKERNGRYMTFLTRRILYLARLFARVAVGAGHRTAVKICHVLGKAEAGGALMVKRCIVKLGGLPGDSGVTLGTVGAKHGLVLFWFGVTGHTFLRRTLKLAARVAAFAAGGFVGASQGK